MAIGKAFIRADKFWFLLYGIAMALLPLIFTNNYYVKIVIIMAINTLVVLGLNLLMGYAGQVSIGHAAFYGIGAYASAVATTKYGFSPWIGLAASVMLGGIVAYIIAIPTLRLKGHYLAMATLGFAEIVHVLFLQLKPITGGTDGLFGIPSVAIAGFEFDTPQKLYMLVWFFLMLGLAISLNLAKSRVGRALRAVHGSEIAAASVGIDTSKYKIQVFVLSAVMACIGGSMYAHMAAFVSPESFTLGMSIMLVTMVVFGGMANIWGAVVGASTLTLLEEYLKAYEDFNMVIFGVILVFAMVFMPQGLIGAGSRILAYIKRKQEIIPETAGEESAAS